MEVDDKPSEDYTDIGGLDKQIQELIEVVYYYYYYYIIILFN